MFAINIFICIPLACQEWVLLADDLTIKKCCQCWILLSEAGDLEVATQVGIVGVHMLQQIHTSHSVHLDTNIYIHVSVN